MSKSHRKSQNLLQNRNFFFKNRKNLRKIGFRGTEKSSLRNWVYNFLVAPAELECAPDKFQNESILVHEGFRNAASYFWSFMARKKFRETRAREKLLRLSLRRRKASERSESNQELEVLNSRSNAGTSERYNNFEIKKWLEDNREKYDQVYFTGHSLGGAMAVLTAGMAAAEFAKDDTSVREK